MISIPGRIPIRIHFFFWIVAALIGWLNSRTILGTSLWMLVIVASILVHEFGHALSAISFGQKARIDLIGFGGVTVRSGPKLALWKEFLVVLGGPGAGFLLFGLSYYLLGFVHPSSHSVSIASYVLSIFTWVNLFWTLINLLPIQPLDGGRLVAIVLEAMFGVRGIKIALFFSILFAGCFAVFLFVTSQMLAGAIFLMFLFEGYRDWRSTMSLTEHDQNEGLQLKLKEAESQIKEGQHASAIETLNQVRSSAGEGMIRVTATQYLAELLSLQGDFKKAYDMLVPIESKLSPEFLFIYQQLAYKAGDLKRAIEVGTRSYQEFHSYETAILNAKCHALLGEVKPAIGWLQCAFNDGFPNLHTVLEAREFDYIRNDSHFQDLSKRL
jgi:Zn-dependent protease